MIKSLNSISSCFNNIQIFDTTLRDGEQSPGASMTLTEKLNIATFLSEMGVDVIEAGFPIASIGDFETVREIAKVVTNSKICALARSTQKDIERAGEAIKLAKQSVIHVFISTSPLHRKMKLKMSKSQILEIIKESVTMAKNLSEFVEWSAEDATRTELSFLCECAELAIKHGATVINLPDTVGFATPKNITELFTHVINNVKNADKAIFSCHCHDDLGLATANSLAGLQAGARQIECTINGIGERAGNAALEEIVVALNIKEKEFGFKTNIKTQMLNKASKMVSAASSFPVQPNKAIVGKNAFAHESGIHQDGIIKAPGTYEIIDPASVGASGTSLVLGKHSGRNALTSHLKQNGFNLPEKMINTLFEQFKALTDKKKKIYEEDIEALVYALLYGQKPQCCIVDISVTSNKKNESHAKLTVSDDKNKKTTFEAMGDGSVDALFNAAKKYTGTKAKLATYQVHAVTKGTDAQAEVVVRLVDENTDATGKAISTDTLIASTLAYINAAHNIKIKTKNKLK